MKLQTPLPASMRHPVDSSEDGGGGGGGGLDEAAARANGAEALGVVDLVAAVCDALSVWEVVVKKQVSSPFAERDENSPPPTQHVKKINNTWKIAEKNAALSAVSVGGDGTPGPGIISSPVEKPDERNSKIIDIAAKTEDIISNEKTDKLATTAVQFSTLAGSGLFLLTALSLGAFLVFRSRSK